MDGSGQSGTLHIRQQLFPPAVAETEKILTTLNGVREPKCPNALWKVKECYPIKKTIVEDVMITRMRIEFTKGAMEQCISDGNNSIVLVNKKIFYGTATPPRIREGASGHLCSEAPARTTVTRNPQARETCGTGEDTPSSHGPPGSTVSVQLAQPDKIGE
ncbi:hypothetical protein B9Z55_025032 [Caenorhabditis nigoni]|uniref:Uncharacterized protein n=1 Tax=Caenorhabditis nigoni TaxID=1611254 RepID=A0A2G5SXB7_9PELO|nr:hypothetical protein B9Z55_025032 [Caenorhabditis nigoni]